MHLVGVRPRSGTRPKSPLRRSSARVADRGVCPVHLHVPVGADHQQPGPREVTGEVDEKIQGAAVGPVEVFQDEQQRLDAGGAAQERRHGLEQPPAVVLGVAGGRGSTCTRSLISETMRATSAAAVPSSARRASGSRART